MWGGGAHAHVVPRWRPRNNLHFFLILYRFFSYYRHDGLYKSDVLAISSIKIEIATYCSTLINEKEGQYYVLYPCFFSFL